MVKSKAISKKIINIRDKIRKIFIYEICLFSSDYLSNDRIYGIMYISRELE